MSDYVWLKTITVAEIKFTEWTSGEVLRHPEFVPSATKKIRAKLPASPNKH
jgi:hypothetical protein